MSAAQPNIDAELEKALAEDGPISRKVPKAVRAYLEQARERLADVHAESRSGRVVNEANSDFMDRLVRRLFMLAEEHHLRDGGQVERGLSVLAVGGYARREMSIHSDVDLLILYRDDLSPYVAGIAERLQYWLWDAGLSVGCATRTLDDTVMIGREDVTVRTAVLTARFLCGDGEFFHVFADRIRSELVPDVPAFIAEGADTQQARHEDYGDSLFLLQPNVKEGAGTVRDYHTAYWVARAAQPSLRDLDDLLHFGLLTDGEMQTYRAALDFLWRVRNELHLRTKRATDQMSFELQELAAEGLGYGSTEDYAMRKSEAQAAPPAETGLLEMRLEADDPDLPVERFMREYYMHARVIQNFSELIIDQCRARVSGADPADRVAVEVEDGFRLANDHLEIPHAAHLRERPIRLLLAFEIAQTHDVPLSRMARRFVRENLDLVSDAVRSDPSWVAAFERILNAEKRVMRTLMEMNEVGFLGTFLPEWQHIVCRWQHVIYHTYTVDVHSIFLVEELRRLWRGKYEKAMPELTQLMRSVGDRPALFLGCLLHDIGKGFGGDHSRKGVVRAIPLVERLGLGEERAKRIIFIVEHHLLMSHLAQSRDLSDPKLLYEFAQLCGDRTNLRNLYLATFADIRASSRDAWTDWKGQLLAELYERAAEMLETGADADKAMDLIEARVEKRRDGAQQELAELGIDPTTTEAFFAGMHRRYFVTHTPRQIARHAKVVLDYSPEKGITTAFRPMRADFTEFILCARDVHGLYSMVAGTLAAQGFNILGSHVYTTREGLALEIYRISTPPGGDAERELAFGQLREALEAVVRGETRVEDLRARRLPGTGQAKLPMRKAPRVAITTEESDFYTVVDVIADDRIGLLHDVTKCIGDFGLEIYISKAATIKDQVTDTFYLKDGQGRKPTDPDMLESLRLALLVAAEGKSEDEAEA